MKDACSQGSISSSGLVQMLLQVHPDYALWDAASLAAQMRSASISSTPKVSLTRRMKAKVASKVMLSMPIMWMIVQDAYFGSDRPLAAQSDGHAWDMASTQVFYEGTSSSPPKECGSYKACHVFITPTFSTGGERFVKA